MNIHGIQEFFFKIMQRINTVLFRHPSKWFFWLCIAFFCRGILFLLEIHIHLVEDSNYHIQGFWGSTWGDSGSYLLPIENLIHYGKYSPDYRIPAYGALYFPLLLLFSKATACNILIIIQFIFSSLSVYCLALTAIYIFKKNVFFYLTFYLFALSTYSCLYDDILMTESLTTSMLIFSIFYFSRYFESKKIIYLTISGLCMAWAVLLRPVFTPLFAVLIVIFIYNTRKKILCLVLLLPFILFDGLWIIHNYSIYNKLIPFNKSIYIYHSENNYQTSVLNFCKAWGGIRSEGNAWLFPYNDGNAIKPDFPSDIFTSKFNIDSLQKVKNLLTIVLYDSATLSNEQLSVYENEAKDKLDSYTKSIRNEKPGIYYIRAPLHTLKCFFKIPYYSQLYLNTHTTKLSTIYYYLTLFFGFAGILCMLPLVFKPSLITIFPFIGLYTIIIHAIIFRTPENRYFVPAYPFIIICAAYFIYWCYNKVYGKIIKGRDTTP